MAVNEEKRDVRYSEPCYIVIEEVLHNFKM